MLPELFGWLNLFFFTAFVVYIAFSADSFYCLFQRLERKHIYEKSFVEVSAKSVYLACKPEEFCRMDKAKRMSSIVKTILQITESIMHIKKTMGWHFIDWDFRFSVESVHFA